MTKQVWLFLAQGFEEIEALTPIDVLRRAGAAVTVVSITGDLMVTGAHEIAIKADVLFEHLPQAQPDIMVLPGGMPGTNHLNDHEGLKQMIRKHVAAGLPVGAICAAPIILGDMGLLNGHVATCYPGNEKRLSGATVTSNLVEVSLPFITARGVGAAMDFALQLVTLLFGADVAAQQAARMVVNH